MGSQTEPYGRRLIPTMIDDRALETPNRQFAIIPKSDNLQDGFKSLSYQSYANAINKLSWWLEDRLGRSHETDFETVAYIGPNDLRYAMLCTAAVKTHRQALIPLPYNSPAAQTRILALTECKTLIAPKGHMHLWGNVIAENRDMKCLEIPEIEDLFKEEPVPLFQYKKSYEEAKNDPLFIIQTSGTTGLPKPLYWTTGAMADFDMSMADSLNEPKDEKLASEAKWRDRTLVQAMPMSWVGGLIPTMCCPLYLDSTSVMLPATAPQPMTPAYIDQVYEMTGITVGTFVPNLLKQLVKTPSYFDHLKRFEMVGFAGAPLDEAVGDLLSSFTRVQSTIGSTDMGLYPVLLSNEAGWKYLRFHKTVGSYRLEYFADDLYELVIDREPDENRPAFIREPKLRVFHTRDLFRQHPTLPDYWKPSGRADDFVKLASMTKFNAITIESIIDRHPNVHASLVAGDARKTPFVIVEPTIEAREAGQDMRDLMWPALQETNKTINDEAQLRRDFLIITDPDMPMLKTAKGTLQRRDILLKYADKIEELYASISKSLD